MGGGGRGRGRTFTHTHRRPKNPSTTEHAGHVGDIRPGRSTTCTECSVAIEMHRCKRSYGRYFDPSTTEHAGHVGDIRPGRSTTCTICSVAIDAKEVTAGILSF